MHERKISKQSKIKSTSEEAKVTSRRNSANNSDLTGI
jgi:hypothetical protein